MVNSELYKVTFDQVCKGLREQSWFSAIAVHYTEDEAWWHQQVLKQIGETARKQGWKCVTSMRSRYRLQIHLLRVLIVYETEITVELP